MSRERAQEIVAGEIPTHRAPDMTSDEIAGRALDALKAEGFRLVLHRQRRAEIGATEGMAASAARDHALELTAGLAKDAGQDGAARIVAAFADELHARLDLESLGLDPTDLVEDAKKILRERMKGGTA